MIARGGQPAPKPYGLVLVVGSFVALSAALIAGCASKVAGRSVLDPGEQAEIVQRIQEIRSLRFKKPVALVVKTKKQARRIILNSLLRDTSDAKFKVEAREEELVGLLPHGIDLKQATIKLLGSQVVAFYDPHTKEMVLVEGGAAANPAAGRLELAHELTHALQDQHFRMASALEKLKDDTDRALAFKAVAEGDATLASIGCIEGRMNSSVTTLLDSHLDQIPKAFASESPGTPQGLAAPLLFQYAQGSRFVVHAYRRGGWKAVDALYTNPPQSTQQILHPALYFAHDAQPLEIHIGGYARSLTGWTLADQDTYGELLLRTILQINLGDNSPQVSIASAWAGDRLITLKKKFALTVIWFVAFRDAHSAAQFARVYGSILASSRGPLAGFNSPYRINREGKVVLVIIGEPATATLALALWRSTTIGGLPVSAAD